MPPAVLGSLFALPEEFFRDATCSTAAPAAKTQSLEHNSATNDPDVISTPKSADPDSKLGSTCLTCGVGGGILVLIPQSSIFSISYLTESITCTEFEYTDYARTQSTP